MLNGENMPESPARKYVEAFVLFEIQPGKEVEVCDKVRAIPEVIEAHIVSGRYDLVARVRTETLEDLGKLIVEKVRKIDGIIETWTLITFFAFR